MIERLLTGGACCTTMYSHPLVKLVLGELHPGGQALTRAMATKAALRPRERVLDAACGDGATASVLAGLGCHVTGIDANPQTIRDALDAYPGITFLHGTVPQHLPPGPFDAVVSECSLCLTADQDETLSRFHDVLAADGRLLLSDVTVEGENPWRSQAAVAACLGHAGPQERLVRRVEAAGFALQWLQHSTKMVHDVRDRIRGRIDVDAVVDALGRDDLRQLVDEAEAALADGRIAYTALVARKD